MTTDATTDNTHEPGKDLRAGQWVALTLGLIALLILISVTIAWRMDPFGIFKDPRGRQLITSDHERKAKFLLNQKYVPANFDALIIGPSSSVNWHPEYFTGYSFYNESLEGGDASEERKLVEAALPEGHFKVALVVLYPRVTGLHVLQDGFDQANRMEALGSISAYGIEYDLLRDRFSHRKSDFFPNGSHTLPDRPPPSATGAPDPLDGTQDPIAVEDYRAMVAELQSKGTRVIYVASPLLQKDVVGNQAAIDAYMESVKKNLPPAPIIDFNAPEYTNFRSTPSNFIDAVHLSATGASTISRLIEAKLQEILAH